MEDFDAHAHIGIATDDAFIASASPAESEAMKDCRYRAIGSIPPDSSPLEALEEGASRGFHIGEIGLDKRFPDMERQIIFFRGALSIAKRYDRIAVIHIVKAYDAAYSAIKESGARKFLIHGYTGSREMAERYIALGGLISLSPKAERAKSFPSLLGLPFLTETDMVTGDEQRSTLREWNAHISCLADTDTAERTRRLLSQWL